MSYFCNSIEGNRIVKELPGHIKHTNVVRMLTPKEQDILYKHYKGYNYVGVEYPDLILLHTHGVWTNKYIHVNDLKILECR